MPMKRPAGSGALVPLLTLALVVAVVASARAQTETGRRSAEAPIDTGRRAAPTAASGESRWSFAVGTGMMASGDLFKVVVNSGIDLPWLPPIGGTFNSDRFRVTLDEDLQIALTGSWRPGPRVWLRGDFSWARMGAAALALVGQTGEVLPYDELDIYLVGLAAEYHLLPGRTLPYLLAGAALATIQSSGTPSLDQSVPGLRLGVGLQHALDSSWAIRIELRDTIVDLDLDGYRPVANGTPEPNLTLEPLSPQHFWELFASLQVRW